LSASKKLTFAYNTLVQRLGLYTDPESHNDSVTDRQTDGQTDDMMMPIADHTV